MPRVRPAPALLLAVALAVGGCGVAPQAGPEPVRVAAPSDRVPPVADRGGEQRASLYFVRDSRLAVVSRDTDDLSPQRLLELLETGPTRREVSAGIRTALAPQQLSATAGDPRPGTLVVAATDDFTSLAGSDQLLSVAQVVWTVTEDPAVRGVLVTVAGDPVEVPTDRGLTGGPVTRADFRSLAPAPDRPAAEGAAGRTG